MSRGDANQFLRSLSVLLMTLDKKSGPTAAKKPSFIPNDIRRGLKPRPFKRRPRERTFPLKPAFRKRFFLQLSPTVL